MDLLAEKFAGSTSAKASDHGPSLFDDAYGLFDNLAREVETHPVRAAEAFAGGVLVGAAVLAQSPTLIGLGSAAGLLMIGHSLTEATIEHMPQWLATDGSEHRSETRR